MRVDKDQVTRSLLAYPGIFSEPVFWLQVVAVVAAWELRRVRVYRVSIGANVAGMYVRIASFHGHFA